MSTASPWTKDRVDTLTRLWRDGLSAAQIAAALSGVTRNAVIGKIHRLGLSGRAKPAVPGLRRPKVRAAPAKLRRRAAPACRGAQGPVLESPGLASVASVTAHACRWPIGDPKAEDFTLCGARATRGPYCGPHAAIAYRPLKRKPPRDHLLKLDGLA
ncbi:GcrA family cell cycle regulator [Phenylobacterium sp. VNQ135]|uniref:GcrA family cell cycle regulator n=1 Tax=Phenylobacterium sp. VNQ135 TaxID=3400922 RepID=UPI003C102A1C